MGMGSGGAMTGASTRAKDVPRHVMSAHATPRQRGRLARQFSSRRQDAYFNAPRPRRPPRPPPAPTYNPPPAPHAYAFRPR